MNKELEVYEILSRNFDLADFGQNLDSESAYLNELQKALAYRIERLIRVDLDRLLQILYRIDVPQGESDNAFSLGEIKNVSLKLAEVIIRRQLQKIEYSREFYKK